MKVSGERGLGQIFNLKSEHRDSYKQRWFDSFSTFWFQESVALESINNLSLFIKVMNQRGHLA